MRTAKPAKVRTEVGVQSESEDDFLNPRPNGGRARCKLVSSILTPLTQQVRPVLVINGYCVEIAYSWQWILHTCNRHMHLCEQLNWESCDIIAQIGQLYFNTFETAGWTCVGQDVVTALRYYRWYLILHM